jgi:hypothetical protein
MNFNINLSEKPKKLEHYRELCIGSCHAATALCADWQEQGNDDSN